MKLILLNIVIVYYLFSTIYFYKEARFNCHKEGKWTRGDRWLTITFSIIIGWFFAATIFVENLWDHLNLGDRLKKFFSKKVSW